MGTYEGYTSACLPVELVFSEIFGSRIEALQAERKIKLWTRKKKEVLISHGWAGILALKNNSTRFVRKDRSNPSTSLRTNDVMPFFILAKFTIF